MEVEIAHVLVLRLAGRPGTQRCAAQERDLDVPGKAMEVQEPALAFLRAIEGRIPLDRLAHPGNGLLDELIEAQTDGVLPPRHRRDIGYDRCVRSVEARGGKEGGSKGR